MSICCSIRATEIGKEPDRMEAVRLFIMQLCTVQLTSIRVKVDFVVPHGFTVHIRVNIPRNAVPDIKIDIAEVLPRGHVLEHTA